MEQEYVPEFAAFERATTKVAKTKTKAALQDPEEEAKQRLERVLEDLNLKSYFNELVNIPNIHIYNFYILAGAKYVIKNNIKDKDTMKESIKKITTKEFPIEDIVRYVRILGGKIQTTKIIKKEITKRLTKTIKKIN